MAQHYRKALPPVCTAATSPVQSAFANEFYRPGVVIAVILFCANNVWLKSAFPGVITGKLSDFAFCYFFPAYCAVLLSFATSWNIKQRAFCGFVVTCSALALMKLHPPAADAVTAILSSLTQAALARESFNVVDPSDLIALPCAAFSMFRLAWMPDVKPIQHEY